MKKVLVILLKGAVLLILFAIVGAIPVAGIPAIIVFFWINWDKIFKKKKEKEE